jgi:hypothetical protein
MEPTESVESATPKGPMSKRAARTVKTLRWWAILPLPILVIVLNSFGPDGWREPFERLLWLSWGSIALAMAHAARRILFTYVDTSAAWKKLMETPQGAGLGFIGICLLTGLLFFGIVSLAKAQDVKTYIPENARPLLPLLQGLQGDIIPDFKYPSYFGSLIEQESCISLKHSKCWNSRAQLKTEREEGAGLGQFTRAYNKDGSLRFDALAEVKALDPEALSEFNWSTVYSRADLSLKAILVKFRDCKRRLERQTTAEPYDVMAFCDASYNGGLGGLLMDRRICESSPPCDAQRWFKNVEHTSNKSRTKWQGYGKSAFEINREHVANALLLRRPKYMEALGEDRL